MELRILIFLALFIFLLGCKKEERIDPEENTKSYISYSIDGKRYRLEHGSDSQYISFFDGKIKSDLSPYKLGVSGGDSTDKAPSYFITIWNDEPVSKGVWKVSTDFNPNPQVLMSWVHLKTKNPLVYRGYWSFYEGTIEITELTEHTIKGVFSGVVEEDPNSIIRFYEKFQVTDGEFFVNRRPGYSIESR